MKAIVVKFLKTIDIGQAQELLNDFSATQEREPIIVTQNGHPIAVVQSVGGADVETISVSLNPQFQALMQESRRRHDREGGLSSEEVRRRLGLKPFEAKKANGRKRKATSDHRAKQGAPKREVALGRRSSQRRPACERSAAGDR